MSTSMKYVRLGNTGLKVSRLCLGCMSFGREKRKWILDEEQSRPIIRRAIEAGITFFDTANTYGTGASEEVTGRALRDFTKRDEVVIATKVFYPMASDPNGGGLSRKAIMREIDASLSRLGTDYVDLYQIHRWDSATPIEETLEALHDVVKAGKTRYIGASTMLAWQFCQALCVSERHGWTRFVSMQPRYNLLYREDEREMLGLCQAKGIGVLPYSPLARGWLARPWQNEPTTERGQIDELGQKSIYTGTTEQDRAVVDRVGKIADASGTPRSQIALAWVLAKPVVTAPIVGVTKAQHLEDALAALSVTLSEREMAMLEEPYVPRPWAGF